MKRGYTIFLDIALVRKIDKKAKELRRSRSFIIEEILKKEVKNENM